MGRRGVGGAYSRGGAYFKFRPIGGLFEGGRLFEGGGGANSKINGIPELRLRLGSGVDCFDLETNESPNATDFDVS